MDKVRNILQFAVGAVVATVSLAVMAAVGLAVIGLTLVVGIATAVAMRLSCRRPAPAMRHAPRQPRIWNDGRGKIIDL